MNGASFGAAASVAQTTSPPTRLSIIIPTYNRADFLCATVGQLLRQDFTEFELIIIDQTPDPPPLQHSDPRIRYYRVPVPGAPTAKNEGVLRARGEIILFLDDDVSIQQPDFLDAHLVCYGNPKVGGVGGRVIDEVNVPNTRRTRDTVTWTGRILHNLTGEFSCALESARGANMSFRAEVFREIGGFDPGYSGTAFLEETDFATRMRAAGWSLMFSPRASLVHFSAPRGGVRTDPQTTEHSRFRNTGYYVAKHRGLVGLLPVIPTFGAIALNRAWKWRNPGVLLSLARAMRDGIGAGLKLRAG
jgi:GT2 family glycosyltransferase